MLQLFINNEWVDSDAGKTFSTFNPATGEKIADIQEADKVSFNCFFPLKATFWNIFIIFSSCVTQTYGITILHPCRR